MQYTHGNDASRGLDAELVYVPLRNGCHRTLLPIPTVVIVAAVATRINQKSESQEEWFGRLARERQQQYRAKQSARDPVLVR